MQTFLPYADFARSAAVLDRTRLCKQRVETYQTLQRLHGERLITNFIEDTGKIKRINMSEPGTPEEDIIWEEEPILRKVELPKEEWTREAITTTGWLNHPAVRMWHGHIFKLLEYQEAVCKEWMARGYKDSCLEKSYFLLENFTGDRAQESTAPVWLGNEAFHESHRSNLLSKTHAMTEQNVKRSGIAKDYYDEAFASTEPGLPYVWPVTKDELENS